ncbi:potassium channel family protein [Cellulomonas palmilytica]|uniref:potassium channel family protein n=1 Tax=Cellulomonas palmilytica TaxID=2608402 RepID=UPI001F1E0513|nr:potassium channel family protein [Cellulomonas palmilytica]UJP40008.1 two pore domain potassium channel family protein [Cellulomonas palmilytica]
MSRMHLVERRFAIFLRTPLSIRAAMAVIVTATAVSVVLGGILVRALAPEDFADLGTAMWWALQTVTTVGYGDVVPSNGIGKVLGAIFMLEAIAFIAIVTAAITSSFVERARHERMQAGVTDATTAQIMARLDDLSAQIEALRRTVDRDDHG